MESVNVYRERGEMGRTLTEADIRADTEKKADGSGKAPGLRAGAAKIVTTPSEPVPLAGFYERQGVFTGVHDDLYARAVVFESQGIMTAVIAVDICMFSDFFWEDVSGRIEDRLSIPKTNILLNATHTHGGPALYDPPDAGFIDAAFMAENPYEDREKRYTEELKKKLVQVVAEAHGRLEAASIGFGRGSLSIGVNRRAVRKQGDVWLGVNPDGPVDREVIVVRVDALDGGTIALLFNHGVHGVSMMSTELTGDWCGIAAQNVEKAFGGGIVAPFLSGAAGDVNTIHLQKTEFDDPSGGAEILAAAASEEVIRVGKDITGDSAGPVLAAQRSVALPGKRYMGLLGYDPRFDALKDDTSPVPDTQLRMSLLTVDSVAFAGVSGEIFSEIGMEFKKKSPFGRSLFIGNTNGYASYVMSDREIERGGYEYNASVVQHGGQEAIVGTLVEMANDLRA